jgi:mannose-6-phosphate isomerase
MVWGGRRLGDCLGKRLTTDAAYGESWEVSDHASHRSVVAAGPYAGRTLHELMEEKAPALIGPAAEPGDRFPWLVKFLDACDWLSVQVHPDDRSAKRLWPGEGGKTEAWFILAADPGSRIYAGLKQGVDEAALREACATGTVVDCLHQFAPRPGDCLFLPAGTVHAVGGGVLMAEVQQTSDATFRLFDWNRRDVHGRSRDLHLEQALACIDWRRGPVDPVRASSYAEDEKATKRNHRQPLVDCPYFSLEYIASSEPFSIGGSALLQAVIVLDGGGILTTPYGEERLARGDVWVLPAAMPACGCRPQPSLSLLISTLPDGNAPVAA